MCFSTWPTLWPTQGYWERWEGCSLTVSLVTARRSRVPVGRRDGEGYSKRERRNDLLPALLTRTVLFALVREKWARGLMPLGPPLRDYARTPQRRKGSF